MKKFTGPAFETSGLQPLQPLSSTQASNVTANNQTNKENNKQLPVGSTWVNSGSLNIDIDNLSLGGNKNKMGTAPTMNQLASTPTSPINQPRVIPTVTSSAPPQPLGQPQQQSPFGLQWQTNNIVNNSTQQPAFFPAFK